MVNNAVFVVCFALEALVDLHVQVGGWLRIEENCFVILSLFRVVLARSIV